MPWTTVLARYGEIGIKSPEVRARFERRLQENVETQLLARELQGTVSRERGRLFVETPDPARALDALAHTFGVVSASAAEPLPTALDALAADVAERTRGLLRPGQSFAVRARRTGSHPYTSMDVGREVGAAVYRAYEGAVRVDLGAPDVEIFVEVRENRAFLYTETTPGPGGLPLGSQGRVTAALEDARAVLALWLALRRGTSATPFAWTTEAERIAPAIAALAPWAPGLRVLAVEPPPEGPTRAAALAVARELARRRGAHALVLGDGLEGFARHAALDPTARLPVLRPLTGYAGARFDELVRRTGIAAPAEERPPEAGTPPDPAWLHEALRTRRTVEVPA